MYCNGATTEYLRLLCWSRQIFVLFAPKFSRVHVTQRKFFGFFGFAEGRIAFLNCWNDNLQQTQITLGEILQEPANCTQIRVKPIGGLEGAHIVRIGSLKMKFFPPHSCHRFSGIAKQRQPLRRCDDRGKLGDRRLRT